MASRDVVEPIEHDGPAPAGGDLFREINERIVELGERFGFRGEPALELICECADSCCVAHVRIPAHAYERLRGERGRRLVAPGHENAGEVVVRGDGYAVVSD